MIGKISLGIFYRNQKILKTNDDVSRDRALCGHGLCRLGPQRSAHLRGCVVVARGDSAANRLPKNSHYDNNLEITIYTRYESRYDPGISIQGSRVRAQVRKGTGSKGFFSF